MKKILITSLLLFGFALLSFNAYKPQEHDFSKLEESFTQFLKEQEEQSIENNKDITGQEVSKEKKTALNEKEQAISPKN